MNRNPERDEMSKDYYREKQYYRENREKDAYRDKDPYKETKEKEIYRGEMRDKELYREKEMYRERREDHHREREMYRESYREQGRPRESYREMQRDREMYTSRQNKYADPERKRQDSERIESRLRLLADDNNTNHNEKENRDRTSGDKELEDLRSRLLSKRISKELQGQDGKKIEYSDKSERHSDRTLDKHHQARRNRLIEAGKFINILKV